MKPLLVVWLVFACSASAQTMYKCQVNGKVEYSDKPCAATTEVKKIRPDAGPSAEDRARAQSRLNTERARLDAAERGEAPQSQSADSNNGAVASQSPECKAALRDYDIESRSAANDRATAWRPDEKRVAAKRAAVSAHCQIDLPPDPAAATKAKSKVCVSVGGGVAVCPPD